MSRLRCLRCSTRPRVWQRILPCARRQRVKPLSAIFRRCKLPHTLNSLPNLSSRLPGGQVAACQSTARLKTGIHILRAFFSRFTQGASAKTVWDRCGRSRSPSRSDGGDPAAIPNTENAEATQGKSVKNALAQTAGNPANTQSKEATQGQP